MGGVHACACVSPCVCMCACACIFVLKRAHDVCVRNYYALHDCMCAHVNGSNMFSPSCATALSIPPVPCVAALSMPHMDKHNWRRMCDELADDIMADTRELDALNIAAARVNRRIAERRAELDVLIGRARVAVATSSDQSTLEIKRARLAAVFSVGTQTDA